MKVAAWALLVAAIPRWVDGDLAGATEQIDSALSLARLMRLDQARSQTGAARYVRF